MKCCINIENLGCFDSCKSIIKTTLIANQIGIWTMEIDYMGITKKLEFEVFETLPLPTPDIGILLNTEIQIKNKLNEDYEYILRIYTPDGLLLNNTCYSFKIYNIICN